MIHYAWPIAIGVVALALIFLAGRADHLFAAPPDAVRAASSHSQGGDEDGTTGPTAARDGLLLSGDALSSQTGLGSKSADDAPAGSAPSMPESGALILLGTGLAGLGVAAKRMVRRRAK